MEMASSDFDVVKVLLEGIDASALKVQDQDREAHGNVTTSELVFEKSE